MTRPTITALRAVAAPDRRRVYLQVEVADFDDPPPYLELHILNAEDEIIGQMLVMGVVESPVEVTLHLRPPAPAGDARAYRAVGRLFFGSENAEEETFSVAESNVVFSPGGNNADGNLN